MTNSQIRDFEFVLNRCIKDITVVGPTITFNAEWDMVVQQNGNKLFYQVSLGPSVPPVTTLPAATGVYVMGCDIDVEKLVLCETITPTNIVQFVRVKVYNASTGEILVTRDFELDETTPYTVVDENNVTACGTEANVTYTPNQNIATNGAPVVLPAGVRSFTVSNLGLNGEGLIFADITTANIGTSNTIPALVDNVTWSVEEDQNGLAAAPITITPAAGHFAYVTWVA